MIKNIIFDLGKVITDIHFQKTTEAFSKLGNIDASKFISYQNQTTLFDDIETGKISPNTFRNEIRKLFNIQSSDSDINKAWNALIGKTDIETLELVNSLRPKFKTFILSNTNAIHIDCVNRQLLNDYQIENLSSFFDAIYFSHEIKARKPNKEAYLFVLEKNKLKASETIFIDDKQENLDGAEVLGIKTYLKQENVSLKSILKEITCLG